MQCLLVRSVTNWRPNGMCTNHPWPQPCSHLALQEQGCGRPPSPQVWSQDPPGLGQPCSDTAASPPHATPGCLRLSIRASKVHSRAHCRPSSSSMDPSSNTSLWAGTVNPPAKTPWGRERCLPTRASESSAKHDVCMKRHQCKHGSPPTAAHRILLCTCICPEECREAGGAHSQSQLESRTLRIRCLAGKGRNPSGTANKRWKERWPGAATSLPLSRGPWSQL